MLFAIGLAILMTTPSLASRGSWKEVGKTSIPLYYYQGVTHDPQGNRYFTGVWVGLYRTDQALNETARNDDVIPPEVHARENYNHIGDLSYHDGKLYLPLECYYPPVLGNTCKTGSIGVADADTLEFAYYVKLDPNEIEKVMWNEVSPNGKLMWTQQGEDLLAYAMRDITQENAAPDAEPIHHVRKLKGAVPPTGITGATFIGNRLFVAGQEGVEQIWAIDLATGRRKLQVELDYIGESEGLDDDFDLNPKADSLKGALHWMVQPYNEEGYPTNGVTNGTLYHFEPTHSAGAPLPERGEL